MKGTFRIGGALVFGILMVLGALYVQKGNATTEAGSLAVVTDAPERSAIKTVDTDKDGIPDWEESLGERVFKTIETPVATSSTEEDGEYVPPTTFTGKFSEAFFEDYLNGKVRGEDFSDPSVFVGTAIQAIEQNTKSRQYSRLEFVLIPDSKEALRTYGNRIAEIIKTHSINNKNEVIILQEALATNDPKKLEDLKPIHNVYTNIIADTLAMEVPESLGVQHAGLLNAYEAIRTDVEGMQIAFTDPLYALARVKTYENDALQLYQAFQNIATTLSQNSVTYATEESGAFFYLFDT